MDHTNEGCRIPVHVLEGTSQELSATRAHDFLRETEKAAALYLPLIPEVEQFPFTHLLYVTQGKKVGEHTEQYNNSCTMPLLGNNITKAYTSYD